SCSTVFYFTVSHKGSISKLCTRVQSFLLSFTDEPFVLEDHIIHITAMKFLFFHALCLLAKLFTWTVYAPTGEKLHEKKQQKYKILSPRGACGGKEMPIILTLS
ncbi:MAG: hypothetical protein Q3995_02005, partial [Eubacteriales bacterium]|nr:hypothetical protein [Eubacteriales bacterium]